jgi:ABC-2 type transport system permease protein
VLALLVVVVLQVVAVTAVALGLGWRFPSTFGAAVAVLALGVVTFAGIGFLLAGRLRAEMNLAVANALFLLFLLLGGIVVPFSELPEGLRSLAGILPAEPLASALRATLTSAVLRVADVATLVVWGVIAGILAMVMFRWD